MLTNAIVFVSTRSGTDQIYVINSDGSNVRALTNSTSGKSSPDVLPDGTRIVFSADVDSATRSIFVMNSDGTEIKRLTTGPGQFYSPTWNSGGARIAYVGYPTDNAEVFVMNADGSGSLDVSLNPQNDNHPSWTQNGDLILFDSYRTPPGQSPGQIYAKPPLADTTALLMAIGTEPSWSPTGSRFVYVDSTGALGISSSDRATVSTVPDSISEHNYPRWSGDESKIVFMQLDNLAQHPQIWVVGTDGSNPHALTTLADGDNFTPSWTRH